MNKKILIAGTVVLTVSVIIYLALSIFFLNHFQFHTMLNDNNVSLKTAEEIEREFKNEATDYHITIVGRSDLQDTISADEISLQPVFDGSIERILHERSAFAWPLSLFANKTYTCDSVAEYSAEKLKDKINGLCFWKQENVQQPVNASYTYANGGYQIIPEQEGSLLDRSRVMQILAGKIGAMEETVSLDDTGCYQEPAVKSDNAALKTTVENLNQFVGTSLTFTFGDSKEVLNGNTIKDWLTVEGTSVKLNEEAVKSYVRGLAQKYDTFGKRRSFQTTGGKKITVQGGNYGWWMDRVSTIKAVTDAIKAKKTGEMSPVYFATAAAYGENDYGNSYVEIDLDAQHVYIYQDGKMVTDAACVSGKAIAGHGTPDGTYAITYKEKDATLVGENYSSPVKFWMPFNGNIGLHDASWRSKFGGDIYINGGSHGCVNLPPKKAKQIFSAVQKGEAVIVYGGMTQGQAKAYNIKNHKNVPDNNPVGAGVSASVPDVSGAATSQVAPVTGASVTGASVQNAATAGTE